MVISTRVDLSAVPLNSGAFRYARTPSDLAPSVNRSNYFTDSDGVDILERLGDNPGIRHLSELPIGLIPGLLRARGS